VRRLPHAAQNLHAHPGPTTACACRVPT
jgi:hypothetical protein